MKSTNCIQKYCLVTIVGLLFIISSVAFSTPRWMVTAQGSKNIDYYKSIAVIDDDTIYVVANTSKVLKTIDGGANWTTTNLPAWGSGLQPRAITFASPKVGYIAGDNSIAKTTDYGKTWTKLVDPGTGIGITAAYATSESTCYFGATGKVFYTNDGGATFSSTTVGTSASSVFVTKQDSVFRAGASGGIYKSSNGAQSFRTISTSTTQTYVNNTIPCIYFTDNNVGFAVGLYKTGTAPFVNNILKTIDGGSTWRGIPIGVGSSVNTKGPNAVCIPSNGIGYVVGTVPNDGDIYIWKTTNAGETFTRDTIGSKSTDYYAVAITPRGDVYIAGNGYVLMRKIDAACAASFSPADGILPDATIGEQFSSTISQIGYTSPVFSATNMPEGLNINSSTGVISGVPTTKGTKTISVTVSENECSVQKTFTLKVWEPLNPTIVDFDNISREFTTYLCTYAGNIDNTKQTVNNPSLKVGSVLTGTTASDAISIKDTLRFMDFQDRPVIEVKVLAPSSGILKMRLGKWGSSGVVKDIEVAVQQSDDWQTIKFDYTSIVSSTYNKLSIFFDFNTSNENTWYFDDIKQAEKHSPTEFRLVDQLQSNMVIQQGKPFKLWGRGVAGESVTVTANFTANSAVTTIAADNTWSAMINVPNAIPNDFTKHQITISNGQKTIILNNLLIGDVWFCSGQSNMAMTMFPNKPWHNGVTNYEAEIAAANFPNIRLWQTQAIYSKTPVSEATGTWTECSPSTVAQFSAVAYYFGQNLHQELNIPIGLVLSARGATPCQAYIERSYMETDEIYKTKYLDPYDALFVEKGDTAGLNNPTLMYNTLINPFINLSIKGYIWYQGENNAGDRSAYTRLNDLMIKCWRDKFAQGDLPFYLVQMTPHTWGGTNLLNEGYAYFREAQEKILETTNTGMAVTMDVGEFNQIHPSNKKPVGQRLAAWALAKTYQKAVQYKGPWYKNMEIVNDTIIINYNPESLGGGMITSNDSMPRHFFVCASDKKFYPAYAAIAGNKVKLFSPNVISPIAARYAFNTYAITNLQNIDGFPAAPFRTDNWDYNSGQIYMTNELDESQSPFNKLEAGIKKNKTDASVLQITPNPARNTIELKYSSQQIVDVQIFDMNGSMCLNRALDGSLIDIQNFAKGTYIVSATLQNKRVASNIFIKE